MNTSLTTVWDLIQEAEKGWEKAKLAEPKEHLPKDEPKAQERSAPVELTNGETSGYNALEEPTEHLPKKEEDADVMQLEKDLAEGLMTPDHGMSSLGKSLHLGAAVEPDGMYQRNFCPDPPSSEEASGWQGQDSSDTLVAQQRFVPKEEAAIPLSEGRLKQLAGIQK